MYVSGGQGPDGKRTWHNIREAAGQTRPTLLETVYGLDVIIPGKPLGSCDMSQTEFCGLVFLGSLKSVGKGYFSAQGLLQALGHLHARKHEHECLFT